MGEVKIVWAAPPQVPGPPRPGGSETLINYLSQALLTTPVKPGGKQLALTIFILRVVSSRAIIKREKPPPLEGGGPDQLGQLALTYWMPQSDYNLDSYWAVKTSQGAHLRLYRYLYMYMYIYIYIFS